VAPSMAALLSSAIARGDRPAFRVLRDGRWGEVTWRQFGIMACAAAAAATELAAGSPVLLAMDNSVDSLAALAGLAAARIDCAIFERQSSLLNDEESVLHGLGASVIVGAADRTAGYRRVPAEYLTGSAGDPRALAVLQTRPENDSAIWQWTSGSTGEPRLARQAVANLIRGGMIYTDRYRITSQDLLLVTVPMTHSFGLVGGLMSALLSGAQLHAFTQFSTRPIREALEIGATMLFGTPLVYELMTRSARPAASTLRMALSSGGPLEPRVAEEIRQVFGCPVFQVYGSTEMGLIASQFPRDEPWQADSVGYAASGVELRLGGRPEGASDDAELLVRTSTMFGGYLGAAGQAHDPDSWYATGDMAFLDPSGELRIVGRKDSFINVGGRKVNPSRVERIISGHGAVAEVAVYGVPTVGGEEVLAVVAFSHACTAEELLQHCRSRLAPYEVPYRLHIVDRLPRTGMGKVDRSQLPR
jgi:acyl-CoA synthetase (AMP-forming)/AMP-acid ligase II